MEGKNRVGLSWLVVAFVILAILPLMYFLVRGAGPFAGSRAAEQQKTAPARIQPAAVTGTPDAVLAMFETLAPKPSGESPSAAEATSQASAPKAVEKVPADMMPFMLQMGSPRYGPAFTHPKEGCAWVGIGGQVFDKNGVPGEGLVVFVTGVLDGKPLNQVGITSNQNAYGPGGYEVPLEERLPQSVQTINVQLFDAQGRPLSDPFVVPVPTSCDQNLVTINFQSSYHVSKQHFPLILNLP